jgi:hypothetical protein
MLMVCVFFFEQALLDDVEVGGKAAADYSGISNLDAFFCKV